jgi:hypothetical protein
MGRYIRPLILLATSVGVVWVVLSAVWLLRCSRLTAFKKIALTFICLGAVVPIAILPVWYWFGRQGNFAAVGRMAHVAAALWPTSIELMALAPPGMQRWSAVAFVCAFSILGNVGAYGIVGLIVGWVYVGCSRG